jgi:hypothetical protein
MTEVMFKTAFLSAVFARLSPFLRKQFGKEVLKKTIEPSNIMLTGLLSGGAEVPHPASHSITGVAV